MTSSPESMQQLITPDLAKIWLDKASKTDFINRPLSMYKVKYYAKCMHDGEWTLSNDAICFDEKGALLNGQHRLHAVILANEAIWCFVTTNMPRETFKNMDNGVKRTNADVYGSMGMPSPTKYASGLDEILYFLDTGRFGKPGNVPVDHDKGFIIFAKYHNLFQEGYNFYCQQKGLIRITLALCVALYVVCASIDEEKANIFFDKLVSGQNLEKTDIVYLLRNSLEVHASKNPALKKVRCATYTIKGWNFFTMGIKRKLIKWDIERDEFPSIHGFSKTNFLKGI